MLNDFALFAKHAIDYNLIMRRGANSGYFLLVGIMIVIGIQNVTASGTVRKTFVFNLTSQHFEVIHRGLKSLVRQSRAEKKERKKKNKLSFKAHQISD